MDISSKDITPRPHFRQLSFCFRSAVKHLCPAPAGDAEGQKRPKASFSMPKWECKKSQFSAMPPLFLTSSPLTGRRLPWWVWIWLRSISCSCFRSPMGLQQLGTWSKSSQRFWERNPRVRTYNCSCQCCGVWGVSEGLAGFVFKGKSVAEIIYRTKLS